MAEKSNNFVIYIENATIGCKLTLEVNRKKTFTSWAVKDFFNGLTRESDIKEPINGFFKAGGIVDLYVYDSKHKENIIKNVKIIERNEVVLDV